MFISTKQALLAAKETYDQGNPVGLVEAIPLCFDLEYDCPKWVADGLELALSHYVKTFRMAKHVIGPPFKQRKADEADFLTYQAVIEASKAGLKGDSKFDFAVGVLAKRGIKRGFDTVVKADKKVRKAMKSPAGRARYSAFASDMRPFVRWIRNKGSKISKTTP